MMNYVTIAGHLGADPEVRFTSSGQKVTTLRVAARARRSGKDETIWWKVTVWGEQFDKVIPYFKKGSPIVVMGELSKPEIFTDREGRPQVSLNITANHITFSPFGKPDSPASGAAHGAHSDAMANPAGGISDVFQSAAAGATYGQGKAEEFFSDDEIPF